LTCHFTHALDFVKPNIALDLHWALSANVAHAIDYNAVWFERQAFSLGKRECFVLSDEYEVVFSLISLFKDLERGAGRLKAFVDLYRILSTVDRNLDWTKFVENRRRERILSISMNMLALFLKLFDCTERFPHVADVVGRNRRLSGSVSCNDGMALLEASPGALKNKFWGASLYECSRTQVFLWWLGSLPFRLAVHERGKHDSRRRRVQQTGNGALGPNG
jgi:hypothetical protein